MTMSRRQLIGSAALAATAASIPNWLAGPLLAQVAAPARRHEASSTRPEAVAAIRAYRRAVQVMRQRPEHDPTGWTWQANTHGYDSELEFDRVFPARIPGLDAAERDRRLAMARRTWGRCVHGFPAFLPWHRVYLYFFERMIQQAAGEPTLGLPYWDWTQNRTLPLAFREAVDGSQDNNALYWRQRNQRVSGDAAGRRPSELSDREVAIDMLGMREFDERLSVGDGGFQIGFSPQLESDPHGQVHVFVGGSMGLVETAGRDPVFWVHHANVDRLWQSWSADPAHAMPRTAATERWLAEAHTVVDHTGALRSLTTRQVLDAARILELGYEYDRLEPPAPVVVAAGPQASGTGSTPGGAPPAAGAAPSPPATASVMAAKPGAIPLSNTASTVRLEPAPSVAAAGPLKLQPGSRAFLLLKGLTAERSPGDNFAVYVNLPDGADPGQSGDHLAGVINFFTAVEARRQAAGPTPSAGHSHHASSLDRIIDVTELLGRLQSRGLWSGGPLSLTFVPVRGDIDKDAKPEVAAVELLLR